MKNKINIRLLRRIQKAILKHHRQFDMSYWFTGRDATGKPAGGCGTAGCIAGWAVHLARKNKTLAATRAEVESAAAEARQLLGLGAIEAGRLFFSEHWPSDLHTRYVNAKTSYLAARAAATRIERFIKFNAEK